MSIYHLVKLFRLCEKSQWGQEPAVTDLTLVHVEPVPLAHLRIRKYNFDAKKNKFALIALCVMCVCVSVHIFGRICTCVRSWEMEKILLPYISL